MRAYERVRAQRIDDIVKWLKLQNSEDLIDKKPLVIEIMSKMNVSRKTANEYLDCAWSLAK